VIIEGEKEGGFELYKLFVAFFFFGWNSLIRILETHILIQSLSAADKYKTQR